MVTYFADGDTAGSRGGLQPAGVSVVAGAEPQIAFAVGIPGRNPAARRGDQAAAAAAISTETLRRLACFGTPEDVIKQVEAFAEVGVARGLPRLERGRPAGEIQTALGLGSVVAIETASRE